MFENYTTDEIISLLNERLEKTDESPIWKERVLPFSKAVLSVLVQLRDKGMLFTPEGKTVDTLDKELFFRWCDFVSLKMLYFKLKDNPEIDLSLLEEYIVKNGVDINNKWVDFPISTYNLHLGVLNVIKTLL